MSVLGFGDSLRGSQDPVYSHYHSYDLLLWKDTKQSQLREKVCRAKPGGNHVQASNSLLPVESHKTYFIPSAMNSDNICEMLTIKEAY